MMQAKRWSLLEAIIGTAIGFVVAVITMHLVLPLFGFPVSAGQSVSIVLIFTVVSIVRVYFVRRGFNWFHAMAERDYDFSVGNDPLGNHGSEVMWVKHLWHRWGRRVDLHKMVRADGPNFFHTHPARAIRFVLWTGYVEEVYDPETGLTYFQTWRPGNIGWIRPGFTHRVHDLLGPHPSYSLWLRGKVTHNIRIGGFRDGKMELHELNTMEA